MVTYNTKYKKTKFVKSRKLGILQVSNFVQCNFYTTPQSIVYKIISQQMHSDVPLR